MSRFTVNAEGDEKKVGSKLTSTITSNEIKTVVRKHLDGEKPSEYILQDKIEDLEFELDCYKTNNEDVRQRIKALRLLLGAFDMTRFSKPEDKVYLSNYFKKVKNLIS